MRVDGREVASIGPGLVVLLGVGREDTEEVAVAFAQKVAGLRIFDDAAGVMNRAAAETGGAVLCVSQSNDAVAALAVATVTVPLASVAVPQVIF